MSTSGEKSALAYLTACVAFLLNLSLFGEFVSGQKHHEGASQYRGLTVGGHTVARITERKVQNRLGQSVQGVPESGGCREEGERGIFQEGGMKSQRYCPWGREGSKVRHKGESWWR